jgi:hypothetical protein
VIGVRTNSVTTPGYSGFNSKTNPVLDPMVTMTGKFAHLDLDPGKSCAPEVVCATSNP